MKKTCLTLGALTVAAFTLAGCGTQVKSLPLDSAALSTKTDVALYFGSQAHPSVQQDLGEVSYSIRIARGMDDENASCKAALNEALGKLRTDARKHNANAVVNVSTRFHDATSDSTKAFTCGVSPSAAAIAVSGKRVVLNSN